MTGRRVLLAPFETAAVATAIRDALRDRGDRADLWTIAPHPFLDTQDRLITGYAARLRAGLAAPLHYDVLQFQFGTTLLEYVDAAWARVAGRPLMLMQYWGDDCRMRLDTGMRPIGATPEWEAEQRDRERVIRRRMRLASRFCDAALVMDLELASYVKPWFRTVYVVPAPLTLPLPVSDHVRDDAPGAGPIVFHAPSHSLIKGTATIQAAIDAVARALPIRPVTVTGVPRSEVLARIAGSDIVVDQLNQVTIGVLALEAMALGKPVLTQFDRSLLTPGARDVPAIPITADTLETELAALVQDPSRRARLGREGQEFVRRVHAADVIADSLSAVYDDAPNARPGLFEVTNGEIVPVACGPRD